MAPERLLTPSQTVGPYFGIGLPWSGAETLIGAGTLGEQIEIRGRVIDGDGLPVIDALIEIWQANAAGRYDHPEDRRTNVLLDPAFLGFGRCPTDAFGNYFFRTVRPGRVPAPDGTLQAPHLAVGVFARGLLKRLATRLYFGDAPENAGDPTLALVDEARRGTLIARREAADSPLYRFDIILQGEGETVFFRF
jgi:protocatechuate 3,4-dioxygenase alpha subunit